MQLLVSIFMGAALVLLSAFLGWYLYLLARNTTSYEQYRLRRAAKLGIPAADRRACCGAGGCCSRACQGVEQLRCYRQQQGFAARQRFSTLYIVCCPEQALAAALLDSKEA